MNIKKTFGYGLFAVLLALAFAACKNEPEPVHVHDYQWSVTKAATCIATGLETGVCKLDATHTTTRDIAIDEDAHDWGDWTGTVTCTAAGTGTRVCSRSETHTETNNNLQALGHDYEWETTTAPTCTAKGEETGTCTRDETHTDTREIAIDPAAHDWQTSSGTAPTCTADGQGVQICSYNEEHIISGVLPALGHDDGEWHTTLEPVCTTAGSKELRCTRDNAVLDTEAITALGHDSGEWHTMLEPDCTTAGSRQLRCTRDNAVLDTESITALGHDYQNYTETTPATCTTAGVETGTCTRDQVTATRTVAIDPDAHNWGNWGNPSSLGILTQTCSRNSSHTQTSNEMVFVAGGSFDMGKNLGTASGSDETPVHTVTLTGFNIGKYQVTQAQWQTVMGSLPSSLTSDNYGKGDAFPVYYVSWYDALVFCNKLSVTEGLTPAYRISNSTNPDDWGTVPTSSNAAWDAVEVVSGSTGYRLPTEAQWEYAAKGGNPTAAEWVGYTYAGSDTVGDVAWYDGNNGEWGSATYGTKAVGTKVPNGLGLYDMSGNVWEKCWDWYENYTSGAQTDPTGASSGSNRVARGGSWNDSAEYVRSAYRSYGNPSFGNAYLGFRLARPAN